MLASPTQTTVIGQMIGQLTGFVAAIAMAFLCYSTIMQIHRGAETARLLGDNMTGMFIVPKSNVGVLGLRADSEPKSVKSPS